MKVSELEGSLLDYWVARAEGKDPEEDQVMIDFKGRCLIVYHEDDDCDSLFNPSKSWMWGGPIIEREKIDIQCGGWKWGAWRGSNPDWEPVGEAFGGTPLIAAMRAYVAWKFGEEVPDRAEGAPPPGA